MRLEWLEKLQKHCSEKQINRSASRESIAEVIVSQESHFTVTELVNAVRRRFPKIGVATVYRNLPVFVESGLLRQSLSKEDGQMIYEIETHHHHDHIVCMDCGKIVEFHSEVMEAAQNKQLVRLGFEPVRHRHVIYAKCRWVT